VKILKLLQPLTGKFLPTKCSEKTSCDTILVQIKDIKHMLMRGTILFKMGCVEGWSTSLIRISV
jgi:hypothetical protein